jgi:hypothetical protein
MEENDLGPGASHLYTTSWSRPFSSFVVSVRADTQD